MQINILYYLKKHIYDYGLLLLSFIVCLQFPQNPFNSTYFGDSSVYEYIGKRITEGLIPYRDIFDHKGPIVYLWHALGYKIYPMYGAWFLELIWLFLSLRLSFLIIKEYVSENQAFCLTCILPLTFHLFDTIGNSENLSLLPITYFFYLTQQYIKSDNLTPKTALLMGLICSFLILIKPTHLCTPLICCLYIAYNELKNKKYKEIFSFILYGTIGFIPLTAAILFWLDKNNALQAFYDTYITFNLLYQQSFTLAETYLITLKFFLSLPEVMIAFGSIIIILCQLKTYPPKQKKFITLTISSFLFTFAIHMLPKNPFPHYIFILFPLTLCLFALAFKNLTLNLQRSIIQWLGILAAFLFYTHLTENYQRYKNLTQDHKEIAQLIQKQILPNKPYASTFTDWCAIYLYSQRNSATKYIIVEFANRVTPQLIEQEYNLKKPQYILADIHHDYPNLITDEYEIIAEHNRAILYKRKN